MLMDRWYMYKTNKEIREETKKEREYLLRKWDPIITKAIADKKKKNKK